MAHRAVFRSDGKMTSHPSIGFSKHHFSHSDRLPHGHKVPPVSEDYLSSGRFGLCRFRLGIEGDLSSQETQERARDLEVEVKPPEPRDALPNNLQSGR